MDPDKQIHNIFSCCSCTFYSVVLKITVGFKFKSIKVGSEIEHLMYRGKNISFPQSHIIIRLGKVWTAIERLSTIWKSDITDKIKLNFFQAVAVLVLMYGWTTWKEVEKKLDRNYTRTIGSVWINDGSSIQQNSNYTGTGLSQNIQVRRTRHDGYSCRREDKQISDVKQIDSYTYRQNRADLPKIIFISSAWTLDAV